METRVYPGKGKSIKIMVKKAASNLTPFVEEILGGITLRKKVKL